MMKIRRERMKGEKGESFIVKECERKDGEEEP
jgi:hypothetical protein